MILKLFVLCPAAQLSGFVEYCPRIDMDVRLADAFFTGTKMPDRLRKQIGAGGGAKRAMRVAMRMLSMKYDCKYTREKWQICVVKGQPGRTRALTG
ncbi:hypothetical protein KL86DES1_20099 [uncultured Desulfovibrio sp.]|uniref:Uncharacterized protein n=1 Tax=uncultured Desulfovibrio sp. TaxID=167968 RepID=A0A212L266_9BACT|nr:hypothetical protein KL86DES1_20099 [uncultured Desulfovibrio sp.]VZH32999.1 conserved protein of unknown function [Desulfovibrio sp. 86]